MLLKNNFILASLILFGYLLTSCTPNKDYLITVTTSYGEIKMILFDDTPLHKANFVDLARAGRYDGTTFHRVMKEFMIQGGDVNTKEGRATSKAAMIPEEIQSHHIHVRGAVAAARNSNPERKSSECQFYIVQGRKMSELELTLDQEKLTEHLRQLLGKPEYAELREEFIELQSFGNPDSLQARMNELKPIIEEEFGINLTKEVSADRLKAYTRIGGAPHLDDEYTVFGKVVSGMEVVDAIAEQATDGMHRPTEDIPMTITVEELKRSKITKLFGYEYPEKP